MFWFYFKSTIQSIRANSKFSIINILGFAFGISVCLAISLFLIHEFSYDRYYENSGRIVRLNNTAINMSMIDYRVKDIMVENFPEVQKACLSLFIDHPIPITSGNTGFILEGIMSVDNDFFEMFSIKTLAAISDKPFSDLNSAVITRSFAGKLFGNEEPVGKEIIVMSVFPVTVTGVIEDFPSNSSLSAELMLNAENDNFKFYRMSHFRPFQIYLQLDNNTSPDELAGHVNANPEILKPYSEQVDFIELKNIYLRDNTIGFDGSEARMGNPGLLRLLATIALLILFLAVINYINLTISQQIKKSKAIGIRKAIGARRSNIIYQSVFESIIITSIAFIVGIFLVMLLLPWYELIFNTPLEIQQLFIFPYNIVLIIAIVLVGIISGSGPAIALSGINPVRVLSGSTVITGNRQAFRNSLTVFQFAVSIVLISCVMIVQKQVKYVKYTNPGFKSEQLIRLGLPIMIGKDDQRPHILMDELSKSPYILNLSATQGVPGMVTNYMGTNIENSDFNIMAPTLIVDTAFLKTFDLKLIKGRNPEPEEYGKVCMINETAWKHFQFESLENKRFNNFGGFDIIGVLNDFHYTSLHNGIEPVFILFTPDKSINFISLRFEGRNAGPVMAYIQEVWQEVMPGEPLQAEFYDELFASMYRSEERFAGAIGLFALLAVVISCIGILGLAVFSTERRTKEIGIRKVNGAKITEVMLMLNSEFLKWVVISFLIAAPVAWYAMDRWLQNFAYRTSLDWWVFVLGGLLALGIALISVSWNSWRAAMKNPVEALRYE
jgi:putative ABC transport system permease protein